jgi:hypothetical protein
MFVKIDFFDKINLRIIFYLFFFFSKYVDAISYNLSSYIWRTSTSCYFSLLLFFAHKRSISYSVNMEEKEEITLNQMTLINNADVMTACAKTGYLILPLVRQHFLVNFTRLYNSYRIKLHILFNLANFI